MSREYCKTLLTVSAAKYLSLINLLAAVYFRVTSEDDIYVQAVPGFMSDMLDRARQLPPPAGFTFYQRNFSVLPSTYTYITHSFVVKAATEKN